MKDMFNLKGRREPIAIIGIGCRFPGEANDPESFWKLLVNGVDAITEIPRDRWNIEGHYHPEPGMPGKTYSRWGGFIKGIDQFDPEAFNISPREASHMDPQQRLALEVAWEALEDGGQVIQRLAGTNTGVFIGISHPDYAQIQSSPSDDGSVDAHSATGGALCIAANRISYSLNFRGPSMAVDTACSSSLVAIHLACQSVWNQECSLALAGGVNVIITSRPFTAFCAASMLSPDGRCKAFDANANGFVRAEGAGIVVLKPLTRALADGDPVYAVILGSAVNQDGRTTGIAMPSQSAQEELIREACIQAGISPADVDYVEAHGTGTSVGDPIEAMAIGNVLSSVRAKGKYCIVGSGKTNIGHLEAAAGIAGVIKVALALKHQAVPANLHFKTPNPAIPFEELKLRVPTSLEAWPEVSRPAIAGVNSFGFGGTNAHLVMAEYPVQDDLSSLRREDPHRAAVLPLSAHSPLALQALVRSYRDFLGGNGNQRPLSRDVCYTASARRNDLDHRLSLVVHGTDEIREHLEAFLTGERRTGMFTGRRIPGQLPKLAFVFSGQGPQWWGMGRDLLKSEVAFRKMIEECDRLLSEHTDWSLLQELNRDEAGSRLQGTAIAQPAIFSLQVALAALWKSWGVEPEAVVGHSVGEVAAAHISGILPLEDAVRLIFYRARCMDFPGAKGRMLAVGLPAAEAARLIAGYEERISVAAINSASSVTLSGEAGALQQISVSLAEKGIFCRFLRVECAFHSPQMDPIKESFFDSLDRLDYQAPVIPFISTVTGKPVEGRQCDKDYWWANIREKVRFAEAMNWLMERDCNAFLELSPHPVLSGAITECIQQRGRKGTVLPSLRRNEEERTVMLGSLGALYTLGYPIEWGKLWPDGGRCVHLPRYPWQRQPYWHEADDSKEWRLHKKRHPLLGRSVRSADPMWENLIDKRVLGYLEDHKVRTAAVFPGAAYVEMALGAGHETFGGGPCTLEEIQFQKAFFLPDRDTTPRVQLVFHQVDDSFAIYSKSLISDSSWDLNSVGYLRREPDQSLTLQVDAKAIRENFVDEILPGDCYSRFAAIGLHFGPSFRGIERIWRRDGEALARVRLPKHLEPESENYFIHPAFLDSCFQVLFSAVPQKNGETSSTLYLPVRIERARFYARPGRHVWSHVLLKDIRPSALEGDIQVYDDDGNLFIDIRGFKCDAVRAVRGDDSDNIENWFYDVKWHRKPLAEAQRVYGAPHYIPSSRKITEPIASEMRQLVNELGWSAMFFKARVALDYVAINYILQAFRDLGFEFKPRDSISVGSLMEQLKLLPQYHHLLTRFMGLLEQAAYLKKADADAWVVGEMAARSDPQEIWQRTLWQYPAYFAELNLIGRSGSKLGAVLQGKIDPLQALFPEGSITTAEHFYADSPSLRFYNLLIQKAVASALTHLPQGRTVRVLEIGAGTGGMTTYVVSSLPSNCTEYVFSDVSKFFLDKAEQKFHDYPFLKYQLLDVEKDPLQQGYEPHSFDLVLASNVLHGTKDVRESLGNIGKLLSTAGLLIVLELEKASSAKRAFSWLDLVFGITPGWWNFRDFDLRSDYPLLARETWKGIFHQVGFVDVEHISLSPESDQVVFLARGSQIEEGAPIIQKERALGDAEDLKDNNGQWLIFADSGGVGEGLAGLLKLRGEASILVTPGEKFQHRGGNSFQISPNSHEDMERLFQCVLGSAQAPWRGTIHLWSLDATASGETSIRSLHVAEALGCHSVLHFVQAWSKIDQRQLSSQLVLVTRGAQPVRDGQYSLSIEQSPLIGLGRVINNEFPNIRCKMLDLGVGQSPDEILSLFTELFTDDPEEEIVLRHGVRFAPRLERTATENVTRHQTSINGRTLPFRLEIPTPSLIDNLVLRENKRYELGPGQIEIEVLAASLNFRDVMKVLGLYPFDGKDSMMLGDECAGRIVALGEGVEGIKVGDAVMAVAPGSFGSYVTTLAALAVPKPEHLTFEEAATIPIAFLTAYYALHHLGRINAGERVLIQSAAGGVGLAALQIARNAGAEIFATAGSPEKREFLKFLEVDHVMDSRSLSFADQISEITGGEGVDIVLNSLAGKAIAKGISALAPYGRFLELGKRDLYQNSKLGLWAFRKNLSFFAIDLGGLIANKPMFIRSLLAEISQRIEKKTFCPLPHRVLPVSRIAEAFRHMAQAKHIGKLVVSMRDERALIKPSDADGITFSPDATYLITGGLGGFGLTVAKWIVENGGRNLVLMGRSGAESQEAKKALVELEKTGARVQVAKADVSSEKQVAELFAVIDRTMPPLRGIFHTAMVLHDNILLQSDREKFRKVMAPKMDGTWNLHYYSLNRPLDLFVLFSSVSSLIGSPGQGNYSAANSFLDAFAHYRRSLGLPAVTINWGHLTGVGYIARHPEISEALARMRVEGISPTEAMDALGITIQRKPTQIGIMRMNRRKISKAIPNKRLAQRFASLIAEDKVDEDATEEKCRINDRLQEVKPEERQDIVENFIQEQVAIVLGASASRVDLDRSLNELGLDSLMAVELKNRIEADLQLSLPTGRLVQGPSIREIATDVLALLAAPHPTLSSPPIMRRQLVDQGSTSVDELSDQQVDLLLKEMLDQDVSVADYAGEEKHN
jgi:acyl transferase domain-containing protein/NADPH:quinone reductase-like Zn-dependent oxidoreductase/NAD(P)-dependent dehydrogenase (short-subunit alcohol dehydrogenase family)/SAM-dependent methyltransferase/acyl carrier protein